MIRRIGRSLIIAGALAGLTWVSLAVVIVLDAIVPWWIPSTIAVALFVIDFITEPLFSRLQKESDKELTEE